MVCGPLYFHHRLLGTDLKRDPPTAAFYLFYLDMWGGSPAAALALSANRRLASQSGWIPSPGRIRVWRGRSYIGSMALESRRPMKQNEQKV
jgi:hypothetical protein